MADPVAKNELKVAKKALALVERFIGQGGHIVPEGMDDLQPLIDEPPIMQRWVRWAKAGYPDFPQPAPVSVPDQSDSQGRCRELFGFDFFGIPEVIGPYGHAFSAQEVEERKPVRILGSDGAALLSEEQSWDAIRRCREEAPGQFVLCAGVPHSVCDVHAKHTDVFHPDLRRSPWFGEADQRRKWSECNKLRDFWFLLRKEVIPDSWDKSSHDQEKIWLPQTHPCERFAAPEHMTYGSVLCYKATQGRLRLYSGECWGRTLQRAAVGHLVGVGFGAGGLVVGDWGGGAGPGGGVPSLWTSCES